MFLFYSHEYDDQHLHCNTQFPKHFALFAIFLTPVSVRDNENVAGEMRILSIIFIFGASRIALGIDIAHCILHIARGLIYTIDR